MTRFLDLADVLRFAEAAPGEEPVVRDFGSMRDLDRIAAALVDLTGGPAGA